MNTPNITEDKKFEIIGYQIDFYSEGKYLGVKNLEKKDRNDFGYAGRKYHTAEDNFEVKRGRNTTKIKKGTKYYTELNTICGKSIR